MLEVISNSHFVHIALEFLYDRSDKGCIAAPANSSNQTLHDCSFHHPTKH
jgi:hypothetical protein